MVNAAAQKGVEASLDQATSDPINGIHGVAFCAVDRNGDVLAEYATGHRSLDKDAQSVTLETTFYLASCTKFITNIACMQLVEQGKIGLDDPQAVYKLCPKLENIQVYDPATDSLRDRKGDITLRTLLAHTAGFGYTFFDPRVNMYGKKFGRTFDEFSGDIRDITDQPLVNDPGTVWEYGINVDWAGIVLERLTGETLDAYCRKNILEPLGLNHIRWFPDEKMRSNIMSMLQRGEQPPHRWVGDENVLTPFRQ